MTNHGRRQANVGLVGQSGASSPTRSGVRLGQSRLVQSNLDLVTNLVIPKTVTKSRVVTKFMVHTYGVSNITKSN